MSWDARGVNGRQHAKAILTSGGNRTRRILFGAEPIAKEIREVGSR